MRLSTSESGAIASVPTYGTRAFFALRHQANDGHQIGIIRDDNATSNNPFQASFKDEPRDSHPSFLLHRMDFGDKRTAAAWRHCVVFSSAPSIEKPAHRQVFPDPPPGDCAPAASPSRRVDSFIGDRQVRERAPVGLARNLLKCTLLRQSVKRAQIYLLGSVPDPTHRIPGGGEKVEPFYGMTRRCRRGRVRRGEPLEGRT